MYEFLRNVCSPSEPPLHFVKVEVAPQHGEQLASPLQGTEQGVLLSMPELCSIICANRSYSCVCAVVARYLLFWCRLEARLEDE